MCVCLCVCLSMCVCVSEYVSERVRNAPGYRVTTTTTTTTTGSPDRSKTLTECVISNYVDCGQRSTYTNDGLASLHIITFRAYTCAEEGIVDVSESPLL